MEWIFFFIRSFLCSSSRSPVRKKAPAKAFKWCCSLGNLWRWCVFYYFFLLFVSAHSAKITNWNARNKNERKMKVNGKPKWKTCECILSSQQHCLLYLYMHMLWFVGNLYIGYGSCRNGEHRPCYGRLAHYLHKPRLTFVLVANWHRNITIPCCSESVTISLPPRTDRRNRWTHSSSYILNWSNVRLHFVTCQTCTLYIVRTLMGRVQSVAEQQCTHVMLPNNWSASWQYHFQINCYCCESITTNGPSAMGFDSECNWVIKCKKWILSNQFNIQWKWIAYCEKTKKKKNEKKKQCDHHYSATVICLIFFPWISRHQGRNDCTNYSENSLK